MTSILINFPTNFGDTVMGLPVLDQLRANYPDAKITAIASARTKDLLLSNSHINEVVFFDKAWTIRQKIKFCLALRGKYQMMVDLKNSFLPVILAVKQRTSFRREFAKNLHIKDSYLRLAADLLNLKEDVEKGDFAISSEQKLKWDSLNLKPSLFIACSSLSAPKRYPYARLKQVTERLSAQKFPLVILGEEKDRAYYADILDSDGVTDLVGKTTLSDVVYLLKNYGRLILCVETGILHLGSYLSLAIVALFGPGDVRKAHPWSQKYKVLKESSLNIEPQSVIKAIEQLW